jgi:hypothetical protein
MGNAITNALKLVNTHASPTGRITSWSRKGLLSREDRVDGEACAKLKSPAGRKARSRRIEVAPENGTSG